MRGRRQGLPPLDFLVAFEAAARHSSFTAAAAELNVTQAAISRQIRLLEENLGARLFYRLHRSVALTPEGRDFQHTVSKALTHVENAARDLRGGPGAAGLAVAADRSVAGLWLLPRLQGFRRAHPEVALRLVSSDVEADCLAEGIDLAIIHGPGDWPGYEAELLLDEEVFPVCSPAYLESTGPVAGPADLPGRVLIDLDDDHWDWVNWRVWLTETGVELPGDQQRLTINSYPLIVDDHLARGALLRLPGEPLRTDFGYYIVVPQGRELSPEAEVFRAWARGAREEKLRGNGKERRV
jgi:DNA-binding transcriptional LysR family regulator